MKCIRRKGATRRRRRRRRFRESTRTIIRSRLAGSKDPRDDISMPCLQNNSNYPRYTKKNTKSNAWNSGERPRRYFHLFSSLFRSPLEPPTLAPIPLSPLTIPLTPASPPPPFVAFLRLRSPLCPSWGHFHSWYIVNSIFLLAIDSAYFVWI